MHEWLIWFSSQRERERECVCVCVCVHECVQDVCTCVCGAAVHIAAFERGSRSVSCDPNDDQMHMAAHQRSDQTSFQNTHDCVQLVCAS